MLKVRSTPIARALASQKGIDITQVTGTGPNGRILRVDIENFASNSTTKVSKLVSQELAAKKEKVSAIRKTIAHALKNSWNNVAYVNLVNEVDASKLWDLRANIKDSILAKTGVKVTFLAFVIKAIVDTIAKHSIFNAQYDQTTEEIVYFKDVNIGLAVDTKAGLMVPVIKQAQTLSLVEIASEIIRLATACRNQKITLNEMQDSTITVTNYGSVDALFGVPVINYPNMAIVGVGAIKDKVFVKDQKLIPGKNMYLTLACDHRWIDGAQMGRFAYDIKVALENPYLLCLKV